MLVFSDLERVFEYQLIADHLLNGKGMSWNEWGRFPLQPTSLFVPLYVYWCAFFQWLFGDNTQLMYIAQCLVAASGVYPIFQLTAAWWNRNVGTLTAIGYAMYPEMVFLPQRAVPEFAYVVLVLWMLLAYSKLRLAKVGQVSYAQVIGLAAVSAVAILTKEGAVVVAMAIGVMLIMRLRPITAVFGRIILPLLMTGAILFTPWWIRNYNVQDELIVVRTGMGMNLFMGNHDKASGTDKTMDGDYQLNIRWREFDENKSGVIPNDEQDRDRFYAETAKTWIKSHPTLYLDLCLKRLKYYLWFDPTHYLATNAVYRMSYIMLLFLALPGFFILLKRNELDGAVILSILGFLALYVPTIVLPRYRIILVLFLIIFAAYFVRQIMGFISTRWQSALPRQG